MMDAAQIAVNGLARMEKMAPRARRCQRGGDLLSVRSADLLTRGLLTLSIGADFYESLDAATYFGEDVSGRYTSFRLSAAYGIATWLELNAELPARSVSWESAPGGAEDVTGLDSPSVGFKLGLPPKSSMLSLALGARLCLPVGNELALGDGEDSFVLSSGSDVDCEVMLLATVDLTDRFPARLHLNAGWSYHGDDAGKRFFPSYYPPVGEGGDAWDNDSVLLRGAVEFPGRSVDLFTEFRADLVNDRSSVALKENQLFITPGVRFRFGDGWTATGGVSMGISGDDRDTPGFDPHNAYPDWTATVMIGYAWPVFAADSDGDGIPDFKDRCPLEAEDVDGFRDGDGCPDPDNDSDGVPDSFDGSPLMGEDFDGFEDDDGVPDLDNDGDGIVDERDMCPNEKEDLDGFEDEDGCPDN